MVHGVSVLRGVDGGAHVVLGGLNGIEVLRADFALPAADVAGSLARTSFEPRPAGLRFVSTFEYAVEVTGAPTPAPTPQPTTAA